MTTATGLFAVNFAALSNVNPYTNSNLSNVLTPVGKILSGVYRWASGSNSRSAMRYNGSVSGNLASKIEFGTAAGGGDAIAAIICDSTGAGYAAVCNSTTSISLIRISALAQADVLGSSTPTLVAGDVVELRLNQTTHVLTVHINGAAASITATDSTVTTGLTPGFMAIADNTGNATIKSFAADGAVTAATISGATPSGTLGTSTTATIGATTDQNTGTLYTVLATSSGALSGITATQIKAGNLASGSASPFPGNGNVTNTSPSISITGLSGNTTYYYATVQNNSNGDSNIITGSFTTANPAAVLSSATPSGTLGTQTTASVGATTTQNSGTLYAILSTVSGDISGASVANIKAGQKAGGSAAPFSGNSTVTTTTPSVAITGLTAGTTYYYALVQNNGNGDTSPITGSFTTAAATASFSISLRNSAGVLLSGQTRNFWTRLTKNGAVVDGGSTGIPITCGSDGVFANSALSIAKGDGYLFWEDPADPYKSHWIPYTFT